MLPAESANSSQDDGRGGSRRMATFFLTAQCNLRCRYCYALENADLDREDWDPRDVEPLIDVLRRHGYGVALGGGEPTVVPDRLFAMLDLCRDRGVPCSLLTNGRLLDERLLRTLQAEGCSWVQVSVDHAEDARLLEPVFAAGCRAGLRMAAGTVMPVCRAAEMPLVYRMLRDTGARGWRILKQTAPCESRLAQDDDASWHRALLALEEHVACQPSPVRIRYEPGLVPVEWYRSVPAELRPPECGARIGKRIFVYPNGAVLACGLPRRRTLLLGNYREDLRRLESRLAAPPVAAVAGPGGHPFCRDECRGGCLQHRVAGGCDSRCRIREGLVPICCYEKLPLAPADPAMASWLPSKVYGLRIAALWKSTS